MKETKERTNTRMSSGKRNFQSWLELRSRNGSGLTVEERTEIIGLNPPRAELFPTPSAMRLGSALKLAYELPTDQMLIGTGYNSGTGEKGGAVVEFDAEHEQQALATAAFSPGERVRYRLKQITDFASFKKYLSVSATVSLGFGIFSADASFEFISSGSFSSYSEYLFLDVNVRNASELLKHSRLTQPALKYIKDGGTRFRDFAGSEYVQGRITGGQFTAVVVFRTKDSSSQSTVRTSVSAAVSAFASGKAKFEEALQSLEAISDTEIVLIRDGGLDAVPDLPGLRQAALDFPKVVARRDEKAKEEKSAPVLMTLLTAGYNTVENLPSNFPSLDALNKQNESLRGIAASLDASYLYRGDLLYARLHPEQFDKFSDDEYTEAWKMNEKTIDSLIGVAVKIKGDPLADAPEPPEQPSFHPKRKSEVPVVPKPATGWIKVFPWDRTFLGRVPDGKVGAVQFRGKWQNWLLDPRDNCEPVNVGDLAHSGPAVVQVVSASGEKIIREIPYSGTPITIADGACQVFACNPKWIDNSPFPNRIRRTDCCTAEALLTVP